MAKLKRMIKPLRALLTSLLYVLIVAQVSAQQTSAASVSARPAQFSLVSGREPVTSLDGFWRFHPGDNAAWAAPGFADETWPLLRSDKPWNQQGYSDLGGYAWYRFTVEEPAGGAFYSLLLPRIRTAYQVFVDGHLVQTVGSPGSAYRTWELWPLRVDLPRSSPDTSRVAQIALRVWRNSESTRLGGSGGPVSGDQTFVATTPVIQRQLDVLLMQDRDNELTSLLSLLIIHLVAGLVALALFARNLRETAYPWFAAFNFLLALSLVTEPLLRGKVVDHFAYLDLDNALLFSGLAALVVFCRRYTHADVTLTYRAAIAGLLLLVPLEQLADLMGLHFYRDLLAAPLLLPLVIWGLVAVVQSRFAPGSGKGLVGGAVLVWAAQVEYSYAGAMPLCTPRSGLLALPCGKHFDRHCNGRRYFAYLLDVGIPGQPVRRSATGTVLDRRGTPQSSGCATSPHREGTTGGAMGSGRSSLPARARGQRRLLPGCSTRQCRTSHRPGRRCRQRYARGAYCQCARGGCSGAR